MTGMPVARRLNALPGTRWLFNRHPAVAFLLSLCMSPLFMWLNDWLVVWGRVLPLSYQWLSALFDAFLAMGIGMMIWNLRRFSYYDLPEFFRNLVKRRALHVGLILVWLVLSLLHTYAERDSVDTWDRRLGLNSIYHNLFLFPFLGYVYTLLFFATACMVASKKMLGASWSLFIPAWITFMLAFGIGAGWYTAGSQFDAHHQKAPNGVSKHEYSNPPDPWCGGVITVHVCGPAKGRAPIK